MNAKDFIMGQEGTPSAPPARGYLYQDMTRAQYDSARRFGFYPRNFYCEPPASKPSGYVHHGVLSLDAAVTLVRFPMPLDVEHPPVPYPNLAPLADLEPYEEEDSVDADAYWQLARDRIPYDHANNTALATSASRTKITPQDAEVKVGDVWVPIEQAAWRQVTRESKAHLVVGLLLDEATQNRYNPKGLAHDRHGALRDKWGRERHTDWEAYRKKRKKASDVLKPYSKGDMNPMHNAS